MPFEKLFNHDGESLMAVSKNKPNKRRTKFHKKKQEKKRYDQPKKRKKVKGGYS